MHISSLSVRNFRAIADVELQFATLCSVIVGPNAVGKTTLLQALRLVKALLSPRTEQEATQILVSVGAAYPNQPGTIRGEALLSDMTKPLHIGVGVKFSDLELRTLESAIPTIARQAVQNQLGRAFLNPAMLLQFFASPEGKAAVQNAEAQYGAALAVVRGAGGLGTMSITLSPPSAIDASGLEIGNFFAYLERLLPPRKSKFSYFPADRAFPVQEQPIQVGSHDVPAQIDQHNVHAENKFLRLKNTLYGAIAEGEDGAQRLKSAFSLIFESLLSGRALRFIGISPATGMLSARVADMQNDVEFELDTMSSGEKGLILTFLLIDRTLEEDGIILFDEPELHLNPAVCQHILPFLINNYLKPRNAQAIICSHSPEVVATSFDSDDSTLYHLRTGSMVSCIRRRDYDEISQAFRLLGASPSEALLFRGTLFVEGVDDRDILNAGFPELLGKLKLEALGGRTEVEKSIDDLQKAESKGEDVPLSLFLFDRDKAPTSIKASECVRLLQWTRTNIENYLIDVDAVAAILKDDAFTRSPLSNKGEVGKLLKDTALAQLSEFVAGELYSSMDFENPGLRPYELRSKTFEEMATILADRLELIAGQVAALNKITWVQRFEEACEARRAELAPQWEASWKELCDGKRLLHDLHRASEMKCSLERFKIAIIKEMRSQGTEGWKLMEGQLRTLVPLSVVAPAAQPS
jgi:predicted ATPase